MKKMILTALITLICLVCLTALAEEPDYSTWTAADFEAVDFSAKTVVYHFGQMAGRSFGGAFNPDNEYGYVTDYMNMFLDLYEDHTLDGYFVVPITPIGTCYDEERLLNSRYVGYWTEDNGAITVHYYRIEKEPTETFLTRTSFEQDGKMYLEMDAFYRATEHYTDYTLECDGTIPEVTGSEVIDAYIAMFEAHQDQGSDEDEEEDW